MHVPEIIEVKERLDSLKSRNLIVDWELPYENLLTRRSAAIFFLNPSENNEATLDNIWTELKKFENFSHRPNKEKKLSQMEYRFTFNKEEAEKNAQ